MNRLTAIYSAPLRFLLFICLLVYTIRSSEAQDIGISTKLDRSEMMIGEQAVIEIKVRTDNLPATRLVIPPDTAIHHAEPLALQVLDTVDISDKIKEITAQMIITSFDSTLVEIPAFGVTVGGKVIYAKPLYLKVNLPKVNLKEPDKFYPNKEQWRIPYTFGEVVRLVAPWLIGGILLVGIVLLLRRWYLQRKRNKQKTPLRAERVETALEVLQHTLASLSPEQESYVFYSTLDISLRKFLAETLLAQAMEQTSGQIVQALEGATQFTLPSDYDLREYMRHSDLAKFARLSIDKQVQKREIDYISSFAILVWEAYVQEKKEEKDKEGGCTS